MHEKALEAAARKIDPLAFERQGSNAERGWEGASASELAKMRGLRQRRAVKIARKMILAFLEALEVDSGADEVAGLRRGFAAALRQEIASAQQITNHSTGER